MYARARAHAAKIISRGPPVARRAAGQWTPILAGARRGWRSAIVSVSARRGVARHFCASAERNKHRTRRTRVGRAVVRRASWHGQWSQDRGCTRRLRVEKKHRVDLEDSRWCFYPAPAPLLDATPRTAATRIADRSLVLRPPFALSNTHAHAACVGVCRPPDACNYEYILVYFFPCWRGAAGGARALRGCVWCLCPSVSRRGVGVAPLSGSAVHTKVMHEMHQCRRRRRPRRRALSARGQARWAGMASKQSGNKSHNYDCDHNDRPLF